MFVPTRGRCGAIVSRLRLHIVQSTSNYVQLLLNSISVHVDVRDGIHDSLRDGSSGAVPFKRLQKTLVAVFIY